MKQIRWFVGKATEKELDYWLAKGWEPFSVTDNETRIIWLRIRSEWNQPPPVPH